MDETGPKLVRSRTAPAWLAGAGVAAVMACFCAMAWEYTRRVTNNLWNDPAFSGWCSAVGHQLATGKILYRDVTLPMPPGSFWIMEWIERASGHGPRLLQENAICAVCYALMASIGYFIAAPLIGRRGALFVAASAVGWMSLWVKQLAYDALAEVGAWATIALLVRAWTQSSRDRRRRWLLVAGVCGGFTLVFKQSTSVGVLVGGAVGTLYLALVERRTPGAWRDHARSAVAFLAGGLGGIALCIAAVAAAGAPVPAFLSAAFVDGASLKGGRAHLAARTVAGLVAQPIMPWSVGTALVLGALLLRIARTEPGFKLGVAPEPALRSGHVAGVVAAAAIVFGSGAWMLAGHAPPPLLVPLVMLLSPATLLLGSGLVVGFFFGQVQAPPTARAAHAFNAASIAALVLCSTVSLSMTHFAPYYENNAMMAIVLVALFAALERGRFRKLSWVALVVVMGQPLAWRLPRALAARHAAPSDSFFGGMRVDDDGTEVLRIADRARSLAGARGTVLSLPEDPSLEALIGRERPALCGAIVFTDQYPRRCLAHDALALERHPPDVLVVRPATRGLRVGALRFWDAHSPSEELIEGFLDAHLGDYQRVATYRTGWVGGTASLEIWKRRAATAARERVRDRRRGRAPGGWLRCR